MVSRKHSQSLNYDNIQQHPDLHHALLTSDMPSPMGLNEIVSAIRKAKNEDKIKGIYLDSRNLSASTATLAEIRQELESFKESGKFIVAYADTYTQEGYYLASVADKVALNRKVYWTCTALPPPPSSSRMPWISWASKCRCSRWAPTSRPWSRLYRTR